MKSSQTLAAGALVLAANTVAAPMGNTVESGALVPKIAVQGSSAAAAALVARAAYKPEHGVAAVEAQLAE